MQAGIAETATFLGDPLHTQPKVSILWPGCLASHSHAAAADCFTALHARRSLIP